MRLFAKILQPIIRMQLRQQLRKYLLPEHKNELAALARRLAPQLTKEQAESFVIAFIGDLIDNFR